MSLAIDLIAWRRRFISLAGSAVVTGLLFVLVVPLSHWLAPEPLDNTPNAVSAVYLPPPPPPPPEQSLEAAAETQMLTSAPRPLGAPIEIDALPIGAPQPVGFADGDLVMDSFNLALGGLQATVFEVHDLDRIPQRISNPPRMAPYELVRDEIHGTVRLRVLISPEGHVKVQDVLYSDHPRLVPHARKFAEKCRFEPPMRNGQPVATAFDFPISF